MATRDELLESIAATIFDYRSGEIKEPDAEHVDRWVSQFDTDVQILLLSELDHVLERTYFAEADFHGFLCDVISSENLAGTDPSTYWKRANLLDIQQNGHSQFELLNFFDSLLEDIYGFNRKSCGSNDGDFIYLDDALFSGSRVKNDLAKWIEHQAPDKAHVHVVVMAMHLYGEWKCKEDLIAVAQRAGKDITFSTWANIRLENRKYKKDFSDVLWPAEIPENEELEAYLGKEDKYPFEARIAGRQTASKVFSGEQGRQVLERELLLAGVQILAKCQNPSPVIRPLGFGFKLGFGGTVVTFRNCPNNCPLALWWGDPEATSGPFNWYPLLPRKTYEDKQIKREYIDADEYFKKLLG
jgi:hypothetical protein